MPPPGASASKAGRPGPGGPETDEGLIDLALGRLDAGRGWWMKVDPVAGLPSKTLWKVLGRGENAGAPIAWMKFQPLTGRTHQLRVHCAEMGFPILGDNIYGSAPRAGGPPLHLHAREVVVPISKNKPPVVTTAPAPAHMREMLKACGWSGDTEIAQVAAPSTASP